MTAVIESSAKSSLSKLFHAAIKSTEGDRLRLSVFCVFFVIAYSIDLLVPWAMGFTIEAFVSKGFTDQAFAEAYKWLAIYVGLRFLNNFFHHLGRYYQQLVAYAAKIKSLEELFAKVLLFPLDWHAKRHSGENLSRLHRSAGAIDAVLGNYIWQIIEGLVKIIFASVALFALDLWVAVNVTAMGMVTIVVMITFNRRLVRSMRKANAFYDGMNRILVDYLFNIITVKSLRLERQASSSFNEQRIRGQTINQGIVALNEMKWAAIGIGYTLVIGSSLFIYFMHYEAVRGAFNVAAVYVLINYLDKIFQAIGSFTGYYSGLLESATAYEDAARIETDSQGFLDQPVLVDLPEGWQELELKNLHFLYNTERAEGVAIDSLKLFRGERVALIGPSGGGKTTVLKILGGILRPTQCEVVVNKTQPVSLEAIYHSALILPQEPEIFSDTVRNNLSMGESFAPSELGFYSSLCKIDEVLRKLPHGLDSRLEESGMNLSVGEKQRIALARGLLRGGSRSIILLDEPTSSLDPTNELQIFYGMMEHFKGRTIVTACHHLALIPLFDRLVFIKRGRIEESGTFQELLDKRGLFYREWQDFEEQSRSARSGN